jgi:hypothetical protein
MPPARSKWSPDPSSRPGSTVRATILPKARIMTLSTIFSFYLLAVAGAAASIMALRLDKRAARVTFTGLALWVAYATAMGATGLAGRTDMLPPGIALLAGPVVAAILLVTLTRPGEVLAALIPIAVLLGFQIFRVGVELTLNHLAGQDSRRT